MSVSLATPWRCTIRGADHDPRQATRPLRIVMIGHLVHHRAQLGIYLRLLDVPIPGMYGPFADDLAGQAKR